MRPRRVGALTTPLFLVSLVKAMLIETLGVTKSGPMLRAYLDWTKVVNTERNYDVIICMRFHVLD